MSGEEPGVASVSRAVCPHPDPPPLAGEGTRGLGEVPPPPLAGEGTRGLGEVPPPPLAGEGTRGLGEVPPPPLAGEGRGGGKAAFASAEISAAQIDTAAALTRARRLVIKIGSALLVQENGEI